MPAALHRLTEPSAGRLLDHTDRLEATHLHTQAIAKPAAKVAVEAADAVTTLWCPRAVGQHQVPSAA